MPAKSEGEIRRAGGWGMDVGQTIIQIWRGGCAWKRGWSMRRETVRDSERDESRAGGE